MRALVLGLAWLGGALASGAGLLAIYALVIWARLPSPSSLPAAGDPGPTAFMREDRCPADRRSWRDLDEIDPRLICTVVWSEDWQLFYHDGVNRQALSAVLDHAWHRHEVAFGGSTIPMQLARNLWLTRDRTPSRKAAEIALARRLDDALDKRRELELYLNAAEWAPCVYGVEAAAQHYFGHSAGAVDLAEATYLATVLPRPSRPPGYTRADRTWFVRHQQTLLRRVSRSRLMTRAEFLAGQRAILDGWADGWVGHAPEARGPGWAGWLEARCGTVPFAHDAGLTNR